MERNSFALSIDQLREIDLLRVMAAFGYEPKARYSGSLEYELTDGRRISLTPNPRNKVPGPLGIFQVWNGESFDGKSGGAGAIDLVMAVSGKPFRAALGWLAATFSPTGGVIAPARAKKEESEPSLLERRFALPERHDQAAGKVRQYLCQSRALPASLVVGLMEEGTIYAHIHSYIVNEQRRSFTNAVFLMRNDNSREPAGSMIRGCYDGRRPRKSTLPLDCGQTAAFWLGEPLASAAKIVVTESPIECLSYVAIHPAKGLHCRTYGGNRWRHVETIFETVKSRKGELICAFNNDEAGNEAAVELAQLCYGAGVRFQRHSPRAKDWNDDLRATPHTPELL